MGPGATPAPIMWVANHESGVPIAVNIVAVLHLPHVYPAFDDIAVFARLGPDSHRYPAVGVLAAPHDLEPLPLLQVRDLVPLWRGRASGKIRGWVLVDESLHPRRRRFRTPPCLIIPPAPEVATRHLLGGVAVRLAPWMPRRHLGTHARMETRNPERRSRPNQRLEPTSARTYVLKREAWSGGRRAAWRERVEESLHASTRPRSGIWTWTSPLGHLCGASRG